MKKIFMVLALAVVVTAMSAAAQQTPQARTAAGKARPAAKTAVAGISGDKAAVMALIKEFEHDFNTGNPAWMKLCADPTSIIDEFPPYSWTGSNACKQWSDDYDADSKKNGVTEPSVKFGGPRHIEVKDARAYVVMPSEYDYKQNGKPVKEAGATETIALQKVATGWRITAWTWSRNR
ncbi:MAG: hypothetical protein ACRD3B_03625 [Candidatus Sulfotelmatobacter sp.]